MGGEAKEELRLRDILDVEAIQRAMDAFYALTQVGIGIIDLEGEVLVATGWQKICVDFHRTNTETCKNCIESDVFLSAQVGPGEFKAYRCKNNMYDIATPLIVDGRHVGNIFLGQFFFEDEPPDQEVFQRQAQRYGFDEKSYLRVLDETPRWTRDRVNIVMRFYAQFADLVSTLGYRNRELRHALTERDALVKALSESEAQHRAIIETSQDGFLLFDLSGQILTANQACAEMFGCSREMLQTMRVPDLQTDSPPIDILIRAQKSATTGGDLFQTTVRSLAGRVLQVEMTLSHWSINGGRIFGFLRDVDHRHRSAILLNARVALAELTSRGTTEELLNLASAFAQELTRSRIAYCHLLETSATAGEQAEPTCKHQGYAASSSPSLRPNVPSHPTNPENPLELGQPVDDSTGLTQNEVAAITELVDPRSRAAWRTCCQTGESVFLDEGLRLLSVPITVDGKTVAVVGAAHKPCAYSPDDAVVLSELGGILADVVERKRVNEHIAHLAFHDPLTRLPNRALLTDRLKQAMANARRTGMRLALCYFDIDSFKPINDTLGHSQGDRVLVEVARRISACVRAGDTVARFGGDEFLVLLEVVRSVEETERSLARIIDTLVDPIVLKEDEIRLRVSVGVAMFPGDGDDADTLLRHADQAMYAAKQEGGDRYELFDSARSEQARATQARLQRVREGLKAGEFELHYQPKVHMRSGRVLGAEALIRWQHPTEGLLWPAAFMPAVERSPVAIDLDRWVLEAALKQMSAWRSMGLILPVSVNLSARHLQQTNATEQLESLLRRFPDTPPEWLEVEILETTAIEDTPAVSSFVAGCQRLGVKLALDDFGTGYSSLAYLRRFPMNLLKIDRSFVRDMLNDNDALALVEGVIRLAAAFRLDVIAEGVESVEHGVRLLSLGCELAQGYGIARPMPAASIPAWVAAWRTPREWAAPKPIHRAEMSNTVL
ncbi:MAG: EAL domain-containing protein [Deltaproteobacteria bacterium]|nr:EAL domain-containing protein [Deltaproteobacteria bacterium]